MPYSNHWKISIYQCVSYWKIGLCTPKNEKVRKSKIMRPCVRGNSWMSQIFRHCHLNRVSRAKGAGRTSVLWVLSLHGRLEALQKRRSINGSRSDESLRGVGARAAQPPADIGRSDAPTTLEPSELTLFDTRPNLFTPSLCNSSRCRRRSPITHSHTESHTHTGIPPTHSCLAQAHQKQISRSSAKALLGN